MNKSNRKRYRFINGTKGVISLFLACLLVPFTTLACALLTAARVNSAVAIFDEALCNASNSTLGTYDSFLRKRFGLLAMAQNTSGKVGVNGKQYTVDDLINETFNEYLKQNLKTLSNTYTTSEATANGIYSLADKDVLLAQILEYSKYSVPAKLVTDGLDIEVLIENIQSKFASGFAITDFLSSLVGSIGGIITLCDSYQSFKDDVNDEKKANDAYESKWSAYQSAANAYKDKYNKMQAEIQTQQNIIDSESKNVEPKKNSMNSAKSNYDQSSKTINAYSEIIARLENLRDGKSISETDSDFLQKLNRNYNYTLSQESYNLYCSDYDKYIDELTELKKKESSSNNSLKSSYNQAKNAYDSANSKISSAQQEITKIKNKYNTELDKLKSAAETKKSEYESAIGTLQGNLKATKSSLNEVQGSLTSAVGSISGTVSQGISSSLTLQKQSIQDQLKSTNKSIEKCKESQNSEMLQALYEERDKLLKQDKELSENDNAKYASAFTDGLKKGLNSIKVGEKDVNIADYDYAWDKLESIKNTVHSVSDYKENLPSGCHACYTQIVNPDGAKKMWKDFLSQIFSGTLWATIDSMKEMLKILFGFEGAVNSALNAMVNTGYFQGGLPSTKNTKSEINQSDKNKSDEWKGLLGSYSAIGDDANGTGDLMNVLNSMSDKFDSITGTDKGSEDQEPSETKSFFSTCKDLFTSFLSLIKNAINSVVEIFNTSKMYQKLLLGGYFIYMTQNRTTYTKTNLSGNSFNLRGQPATTADTGAAEVVWNSFAGLFGAVDGMITADARCFYGAETEYLFGKSMNELQNQKITFGNIYLIRLIFDLPMLLNPDVIDLAASLAPTIIGSIVIIILYILVEPLLDTFILVNGGQIPILKTPFLTKNGLPKLMKCIKGCVGKLNESAVKEQLTAGVNNMYSKAGKSTNTTTSGSGASSDGSGKGGTSGIFDSWNPLYIDYTEQLFLMTMCCPQEDILDCIADIIQMEGLENSQHQFGNQKEFDLTKAYTYIRVEASFATKEFIKLTDSGMFDSTKRIMYRGY